MVQRKSEFRRSRKRGLVDGIVEVQDLIVLAEHLFEEFPLVESVE
jgi:hypothetical protein